MPPIRPLSQECRQIFGERTIYETGFYLCKSTGSPQSDDGTSASTAGRSHEVAARITHHKTGVVTSLDKLTAPHLSRLLEEVLNETTYRDNARRMQKAIVKADGLSVAADLIEQSLGVVTEPGR
jgi:hypothetical protein